MKPFNKPFLIIKSAVFFSMVLMLSLFGTANTASAETLGMFGDWSAFKIMESGKDVCYIGSEPEKAEGDYTNRGDTFLLVPHRPFLGELNVVSVRAGYKYKDNSDVNLSIDDAAYSLFALGEMAWARDANSDRKLVTAMRKGIKMIVRGTSWRGTITTDTYSLKGFTKAYKTSLTACGLK